MLVAEARPRPYASGVVAHGWNIDEESPCLWVAASTPVLVTGWNAVLVDGWGSPSTLLGPEATGHGIGSSWVVAGSFGVGGCVWGRGPGGVECFWWYGSSGRGHTSRLVWWWWSWCAWWVRPLLENCIVDASIFDFFQDCDRETWVLHVWPAFGCGCVCGVCLSRSFLVSVILCC